MRRLAILLLIGFAAVAYGQEEKKQFQVLVAQNAKALGKELTPLTYLDDVTSIEIGPEGFVALVHEGGTTYELKEKTFTFYLKPEQLKDRDQRPRLDILYLDTAIVDASKTILVLHPKFDRSGLISWRKDQPMEIIWHLPEEPVISYKVSVSDHNGKKIQDFGSSKNNFALKPYNYGLTEPMLMFQVSSSFNGETIMSKRYQVKITDAPEYPVKAADLVVKALDLELSPNSAMDAWKEVFGKENGKYYMGLFEKFLSRNRPELTDAEEDIELLLSQNK